MLELSGPGLLGAPGLKSLQLHSMWGVICTVFGLDFPHPSIFLSEVFFRESFFPMGMSWLHALKL